MAGIADFQDVQQQSGDALFSFVAQAVVGTYDSPIVPVEAWPALNVYLQSQMAVGWWIFRLVFYADPAGVFQTGYDEWIGVLGTPIYDTVPILGPYAKVEAITANVAPNDKFVGKIVPAPPVTPRSRSLPSGGFVSIVGQVLAPGANVQILADYVLHGSGLLTVRADGVAPAVEFVLDLDGTFGGVQVLYTRTLTVTRQDDSRLVYLPGRRVRLTATNNGPNNVTVDATLVLTV